jgi:hypothetical protein
MNIASNGRHAIVTVDGMVSDRDFASTPLRMHGMR